MKAIVTGATGFLGLSLCESLLDKGYEVYALARKNSEKTDRLPCHDALHIVYGDMAEIDQCLPDSMDTIDYFFHLAWLGGAENRDNPDIQNASYKNTACAMRVAAQLGARCFVMFGSQAEYGITKELITEETPCHPITEYGKAKLQVCEEGFHFASQSSMKYVHLRIFSVYGEYDHKRTMIIDTLGKMLRNEPQYLSACTQNWNFLYVRDATEQIIGLCRYADETSDFKAGIFNVAGEDTRPLSSFVDEMIALTGTKSPIYKAPASDNLVWLNPSMQKTKHAIGQVEKYTFKDGIEAILRYMKRKCLLCGGHFYDVPLMKMENMPASAQDIPNASQLAQEKGIRLGLYQCRDCGLVQFDTEPVNYYKDVIRAGGLSSTMTELRKKQYSEFIDKFSLKGKKIIEIGCGQGEFLSILNTFDVLATGIEHAPHLVEKAKEKGLDVYEAFAENGHTHLPGAPYDAFVQFNFLEHQPYPNEMLQCIYNNLTDDGVGLVTVPSLEYILENDGYYELIRDHIAYYSEGTLRFLFEKNGFEIVKCEIVNRDTWAMLVKKRREEKRREEGNRKPLEKK